MKRHQLYSMTIQLRSIIWWITSGRKNLTTEFLFDAVSCLPGCTAKMNNSIRVDAVIDYRLPLEHRRRLNITVDCCFEISKQPGSAGQIEGWFEWIAQDCDDLIGEERRLLSKVDNLADEYTGAKVFRQFAVGSDTVHDNVMK